MVQGVLFAEPLGRDARQPRLEPPQRLGLRRLGNRGIVRPAGQGPAVARLAGLHRIQPLLEGVDVADQGVQVIRRCGGGGRGTGENAKAERQEHEGRAPREPHSAAWIWVRAARGPARSSSSM